MTSAQTRQYEEDKYTGIRKVTRRNVGNKEYSLRKKIVLKASIVTKLPVCYKVEPGTLSHCLPYSS